MERIASFGPVTAKTCGILILGTAPSVASLAAGFYYAHGRNAFWPILSSVFNAPADTIAQRKALIEENHLALWDVVKSCAREGSLDAAIRLPEPNDFAALFSAHPEIRKILFNGAAAEALFCRYAKPFLSGRTHVRMPSTSPAYTISFEKKLAQWQKELKP